MDEKALVRAAMEAKERAYAPYSKFRVGAALLAKDGTIYTGCNIENAGYSPTNCAERTAIFKAVSEGKREFSAIAINGDGADYLYPCGVCRQVMAEFCTPDFKVLVSNKDGDYRAYPFSELFPGAFDRSALEIGRIL